MLNPLKMQGLKVWDDREIPKGAMWLPVIKERLNQTKVAVLLVTDDFLSSEFIQTVELREFLSAQNGKGLTILWVLVGDCRWDATPIKDYQSAFPTKIPLMKMPEGEQKTALTEITRAIEAAASGASARAVTGS
jgi:internalin A